MEEKLESTIYTWEEIEQHNDDKSLWVVIHGVVYDVTNYALEHPGGIGILLEHAGIDGTDDFEDVGHSVDAKELMKSFKIGIVKKDEKIEKEGGFSKCLLAKCVVPSVLVIGLTSFIVYKYFKRT
jgi:cytochrome b involved in lipid metabolism